MIFLAVIVAFSLNISVFCDQQSYWVITDSFPIDVIYLSPGSSESDECYQNLRLNSVICNTITLINTKYSNGQYYHNISVGTGSKLGNYVTMPNRSEICLFSDKYCPLSNDGYALWDYNKTMLIERKNMDTFNSIHRYVKFELGEKEYIKNYIVRLVDENRTWLTDQKDIMITSENVQNLEDLKDMLNKDLSQKTSTPANTQTSSNDRETSMDRHSSDRIPSSGEPSILHLDQQHALYIVLTGVTVILLIVILGLQCKSLKTISNLTKDVSARSETYQNEKLKHFYESVKYDSLQNVDNAKLPTKDVTVCESVENEIYKNESTPFYQRK